jgi:hypothetical protein
MRRVAVLVLAAIGLSGIAGGGWLVYRELARTATPAEARAAGQAELVSRWARLTAGQMFPATIGYTGASGTRTDAYLVGIAPSVRCAEALDPLAAAALDPQRCGAVLRATYTDASRTLVVTAGVAVMPSTAAALRAVTNFGAHQPHGGVKVAAFPGTVANLAGNANSDWYGAFHAGPYIVLFAAGYADGQSVQVTSVNPALADLAFAVVRPLATVISQTGSPCQRPDIQC